MKTNIILIAVFISLLLFYGCEINRMGGNYVLYFKNASDYIIDISKNSYFYSFSTSPFYKPLFPLEIGEERSREGGPCLSDTKKQKMGRLAPYCAMKHLGSIHVYFNKGKADERSIVYKGLGFKPRDLRNPDEYVFERAPNDFVHFYYTFTNEDYENALDNEKATPIPIPKCRIIEETEDGVIFEQVNCWIEGGKLCYP